jgi:hypothetical protein
MLNYVWDIIFKKWEFHLLKKKHISLIRFTIFLDS